MIHDVVSRHWLYFIRPTSGSSTQLRKYKIPELDDHHLNSRVSKLNSIASGLPEPPLVFGSSSGFGGRVVVARVI